MTKKRPKKNFKPIHTLNVQSPESTGRTSHGFDNKNINTSSDLSVDSESSTNHTTDSSIDCGRAEESHIVDSTKAEVITPEVLYMKTDSSKNDLRFHEYNEVNESDTRIRRRQTDSNVRCGDESVYANRSNPKCLNESQNTGTKKKDGETYRTTKNLNTKPEASKYLDHYNRDSDTNKRNVYKTRQWSRTKYGSNMVENDLQILDEHNVSFQEDLQSKQETRTRDNLYPSVNENFEKPGNIPGIDVIVCKNLNKLCVEDASVEKHREKVLDANATAFVPSKILHEADSSDPWFDNKGENNWRDNHNSHKPDGRGYPLSGQKNEVRGRGRTVVGDNYKGDNPWNRQWKPAEESRGRGRLDNEKTVSDPSKNLEQTSIASFSDNKPPDSQVKSPPKNTVSQERRSASFEHKWENFSSKQSWRNKDRTDNDEAYPKRHSDGSSHFPKSKENISLNKSYGDAKVTRQNKEIFDRTYEKVDAEYKEFQEDQRRKVEVVFKRVVEIQQDLFTMPQEYSLAHCVAEDLRMGSGIAVNFKRDFRETDVLLSQRQKQGGVAILEDEKDSDARYIYYLITKRVSTGKPTYDTMWSSLKKMRDHIANHHVKKLAIPRLGCGLDRLEWSTVKHMIEFLFKDVEVEITVCNFQQTEESPEKPQNYSCKIVHVQKPVAEIEEETSIIYLSTVDGDVSPEMEQLDAKFSFLRHFKSAAKEIGTVVRHEVPRKYFILNGCIVRKKKHDNFDFQAFRKCVQQVSKNCRKEKYEYIAIQAITDKNDDLINEKIITILKNYVNGNLYVYVCWNNDLVSEMPEKS